MTALDDDNHTFSVVDGDNRRCEIPPGKRSSDRPVLENSNDAKGAARLELGERVQIRST
jgi:hypothetical protein